MVFAVLISLFFSLMYGVIRGTCLGISFVFTAHKNDPRKIENSALEALLAEHFLLSAV